MAFFYTLLRPFKQFLFLWLLCLSINIITLLLIYYKIHPSNNFLVLHYNVLVGVDSAGKGINFYNIPLVGFLISAVNFIFYRAVKTFQPFLAFLSVFTSIFVQLILFLSVVFLVRIN